MWVIRHGKYLKDKNRNEDLRTLDNLINSWTRVTRMDASLFLKTVRDSRIRERPKKDGTSASPPHKKSLLKTDISLYKR